MKKFVGCISILTKIPLHENSDAETMGWVLAAWAAHVIAQVRIIPMLPTLHTNQNTTATVYTEDTRRDSPDVYHVQRKKSSKIMIIHWF